MCMRENKNENCVISVIHFWLVWKQKSISFFWINHILWSNWFFFCFCFVFFISSLSVSFGCDFVHIFLLLLSKCCVIFFFALVSNSLEWIEWTNKRKRPINVTVLFVMGQKNKETNIIISWTTLEKCTTQNQYSYRI